MVVGKTPCVCESDYGPSARRVEVLTGHEIHVFGTPISFRTTNVVFAAQPAVVAKIHRIS